MQLVTYIILTYNVYRMKLPSMTNHILSYIHLNSDFSELLTVPILKYHIFKYLDYKAIQTYFLIFKYYPFLRLNANI